MYKKELLTNYFSEMEKSKVEGEITTPEKLSSNSEGTSASLIFKGKQMGQTNVTQYITIF